MRFYYWKYFVAVIILVPLGTWLVLLLTAVREAPRINTAPSRIRSAELSIARAKEMLSDVNTLDSDSANRLRTLLDESADDLEVAQDLLGDASSSKKTTASFTDWVTAIGGIITSLGVLSTIVLSWRKDVREAHGKTKEEQRIIVPGA